MSQQIEDGKLKPKFSVPIDRIASLGDLDEEEMKKYKKSFEKGTQSFKVSFDKDSLQKGEIKQDENRTSENEQNRA